MVVPIFAPIIMGMACRKVISPELTKPTTITVVAEELWITAVTPSPVSKPIKALLVSRLKMFLSPLPARRSKESPIMLIPNKNRLSPPTKDKISKRSIRSPHLSTLSPLGNKITYEP